MSTYANVITNEQFDVLPDCPNPLVIDGEEITDPTPEQQWQWQVSQGVRRVVSTQSPQAGWIVTAWKVVDNGDDTCNIVIDTQYDSVRKAYVDDLAASKTQLVWANLKGDANEIKVALPTPPYPLPTPIGSIFGHPSDDDLATYYWGAGWRKIVTIANPDDGYRVGTYAVSPIDYATCNLSVATEINIAAEQAAVAAAQQAAYLADLAANYKRYVLEIVYLLLCDVLMGRTTHVKVPAEDMADALLAAESRDAVTGQKLESAFSYVSIAMIYYSTQWWDTVQYRDAPDLVNAAKDLLAKRGLVV